MSEEAEVTITRKQIAIRLLYTLLYVAIFEVVKTIIFLVTIFEFFLLLITLEHNEPARTFANRAATYGYRLMRYLTLNENQRPFPFSEFPGSIEWQGRCRPLPLVTWRPLEQKENCLLFILRPSPVSMRPWLDSRLTRRPAWSWPSIPSPGRKKPRLFPTATTRRT